MTEAMPEAGAAKHPVQSAKTCKQQLKMIDRGHD